MAIVAGVKIKSKKPKLRNPLLADERYTGEEPKWPPESKDWTDAQFDNFLRRCFFYYNYYYTQKDAKKYILEWAKSSTKFDKDQIRAFEKVPDKYLPMTACSLVMATRSGMTLRERHVEYLQQVVIKAIDGGQEDVSEEIIVTPKQAATRPTIQDRLAEKTNELIGELEGLYDEMDKTSVKFYDWFVKNNVVQSQLSKYEAVFEPRRVELELAQSKTDEQLTEGYRFLKIADFKKRITWITDLLTAVEQYRGVKKAVKKARVKKSPSKEKLVSKLKYAKDDKAMKIVSINPADIIGATELWIYNSKTRKLGKYVAASYQTLSVKGTTIVNYDADKSVAKTLRKPEAKLKEFAKASKVTLRTFIKDIRAVEIKLNGRINSDTLLLRVD